MYDVYLGTHPDTAIILSEDQKEDSFVALDLQRNQTYYWYVVVKDGIHEVTSDTWNFTIAPEEVDDDDDEGASIMEDDDANGLDYDSATEVLDDDE